MRFSAAEIADLVEGTLVGIDQPVDGASIDSRSIKPGELFVPIVAERDGHDFIRSALANGSTCYLSANPVEAEDLLDGVAAVIVPDTQVALTKLGAASRSRLPAPVVGVTGSVGKTSVKDLIAAACSSSVATHANKASFNNELGLPLTLVTAPDATKVTVLEMGARGSGHITELCETGRPTIGVVTRVAEAHTELFGDLAGVAAAKGELIEALPADGTAVLNADDPHVLAMAERAACPVVTFGGASGDYRATNIELDDQLRASFELVSPAGTRSVQLSVAGEHMAINAVAAIAVAVAAGVGLDAAVAGVQRATISGSRMDVTTRPDGVVIIDDAYNANPTSVRAALAALSALPAKRRTAVLGVMAELGADGDAEHAAIAEEAFAAAISVVAVGAPAYGSAAGHIGTLDQAKDLLRQMGLSNGDAVLVKGSLVAGLQPLAAWLTEGALSKAALTKDDQ